MKKITINEKNILRKFKEGTESIIYYYEYNGKTVLLKMFKNEIHLGKDDIKVIDKNIFENKRKKIELISEIEYFDNEVKFLNLVYDKYDNFIGYTMEIDSLKTAADISNIKKRIEILKLVREKLEVFNENDIYIGDLNSSNILITNDGIKLCDLDNIRIYDLDFDLKPLFVNVYYNKCKNIENIDNYSFNMSTIAYMGNVYPPYVYNYLRNVGLPRTLDTKANREIATELININDNYEKKYLIDNIKKFL